MSTHMIVRDEEDTSTSCLKLMYNWKRKNNFFNLIYWKETKSHHNLNVMHIKKNIFDNIIGSLLNINEKIKFHLNDRLDLQEMNVIYSLHTWKHPNWNKWVIPATWYTMSHTEKDHFCKALKNLKVPNAYDANLSEKCNYMTTSL